MKKTLKIIGLIFLLVLTMALFTVGPLYYLPVTVTVEAEEKLPNEEEPAPEEEQVEAIDEIVTEPEDSEEIVEPSETPDEPEVEEDQEPPTEPVEDETTTEVRLLGNIILGYMGLNIPDVGVPYLTTISSLLSGVAFTTWIFSLIFFIKREKKDRNFKNRAKEVSPVKDSIKVTTPVPLNKGRGGEHNHRDNHNIKF